MSDAYEKRKRHERAGRTIGGLLIATTVIVLGSLVVWLAFFPPFSGT
jgi:hypothetical protein